MFAPFGFATGAPALALGRAFGLTPSLSPVAALGVMVGAAPLDFGIEVGGLLFFGWVVTGL